MTIFYTISFGPRPGVEVGDVDVVDFDYATAVMDYPNDQVRMLCFWLGVEGEEG